jgi:hypothetical protein
MILVSTQPLTEMITRNPPGGKGQPASEADNLTAICESIVSRKIWKPRRLTTLWVPTVCYGDIFTYFLPISIILKWILQKVRCLRVWTGIIWLRIKPSGGLCEHGNEILLL